MGEKLSGYNRILREKADEFAPIKTKEIKIKPKEPWFDSEYKTLRRKRLKKYYRVYKSLLK